MASSTKVLSDLLGMSIVMTSPESVGVGVWEGREAGYSWEEGKRRVPAER